MTCCHSSSVKKTFCQTKRNDYLHRCLHSATYDGQSKSQCNTQYYLLLFILNIVIFILEKMSDNKLCCI